jgi:uncharacterized protein
MTDVVVKNNPELARYELIVDGELAGFAQYRLRGTRITLYHTEVQPRRREAGLGSDLARAALDDARARGLTVVPSCPFIADFIRHHPAPYLELVDPSARAAL